MCFSFEFNSEDVLCHARLPAALSAIPPPRMVCVRGYMPTHPTKSKPTKGGRVARMLHSSRRNTAQQNTTARHERTHEGPYIIR